MRRGVPRGRWRWAPRPSPAHEELCQACHRINDRYPAGELTIAGEFAARHRDEILHLARHQEEQEKAEHPLHRIMEIEDEDGTIVVRTTDSSLIEAFGVRVNSAAITGESLPVARHAGPSGENELTSSANVLLAGTALVAGNRLAVGFATGMRTALLYELEAVG